LECGWAWGLEGLKATFRLTFVGARAVQQEPGLVELWDRAQNLGVLHCSIGTDRCLDDDDAVHTGRLRSGRVHRHDVRDLGGCLDLTPDADRRRFGLFLGLGIGFLFGRGSESTVLVSGCPEQAARPRAPVAEPKAERG